jgi:pimeloyl-ACP methyl ester carboxylesterase
MPAIPDDAWCEFGGTGPTLVFTHANGFPPATYRAVLEPLAASFRVLTFANRALWSADEPSTVSGWRQLADDLRCGLAEREAAPVVAVGHSIGGMLCALAAARSPGLFSRLVLLDPVVFSGAHAFVWGWVKRLGLGDRFPLVDRARRRRDSWPDRETVRAAWTGRPVFVSWDPRVVEDYLEAGIADAPDGSVTLRYPKRWEAQLFRVCPHDEWASLRRVEAPVLVVRGATSDTLLPGAAGRMAREMPDAQVVELAGTSHFLPMERPDEVARLVVEFAGGSGSPTEAPAEAPAADETAAPAAVPTAAAVPAPVAVPAAAPGQRTPKDRRP